MFNGDTVFSLEYFHPWLVKSVDVEPLDMVIVSQSFVDMDLYGVTCVI